MTDTELDEMLDQWDAPSAPAALRRRVQAAVTPRPRRWFAGLAPVGWKGLFAGALLAGLILMLVVVESFPQSLEVFSFGFRIPYVVESESVRYRADGSPGVTSHLTWFLHGGNGIILTLTNSGKSPFVNSLQGVVDSVRIVVLQLAPSLVLPAQSSESIAWWRVFVANGCVRTGETAIGHETVLGHSTTIVRSEWSGGRTTMTMWLAPDLGCFDLRHINEERRPDGTFQVTFRMQALKVTVNP